MALCLMCSISPAGDNGSFAIYTFWGQLSGRLHPRPLFTMLMSHSRAGDQSSHGTGSRQDFCVLDHGEGGCDIASFCGQNQPFQGRHSRGLIIPEEPLGGYIPLSMTGAISQELLPTFCRPGACSLLDGKWLLPCLAKRPPTIPGRPSPSTSVYPVVFPVCDTLAIQALSGRAS